MSEDNNQEHKYSNPKKWVNITEMTLRNYANMINRLSKKEAISKFVLVYYSLAVIVYTLTSKYFLNDFNTMLSDYFSVILSIVLLTYSLINNNARYSERIAKIEQSLNLLKTLKREFCKENLDQQKKEYYKIVDSTEMRSNVDFFNTLKSLCRQNNINWYWRKSKMQKKNNEEIDNIIKYISEMNRVFEEIKLIVSNICNIFIIVTPVAIFIICIFCK